MTEAIRIYKGQKHSHAFGCILLYIRDRRLSQRAIATVQALGAFLFLVLLAQCVLKGGGVSSQRFLDFVVARSRHFNYTTR